MGCFDTNGSKPKTWAMRRKFDVAIIFPGLLLLVSRRRFIVFFPLLIDYMPFPQCNHDVYY